ncbi:puromycin-sensitive aminopeptidase-like protein isoform X1 [Zootermopsis nevadensis]|uniref:puromycin-sensitive aminopeptidase-like protein isoform X1 n=1 Tax=Zootermopsis nevadensis TaxID=136037 RepID=UPI000B8E842D|nr:puromycin-sensitive aminopeptidase-like protein isoform X1 [Zootermopsis nevadensis]
MQWKIVTFATVLLQILVVITNASGSPLLDKTVSSYNRASVTDYRLPTNVKPVHYKITLNPLIEDLDPRTFTGEVQIRVKIIEETDSITLHYNDLSINTISVNRINTETDIAVYHEYDNITHFCTIRINKVENEDVEETFKTNEEYIITINYLGYHRVDMYGFYRSSYKDENGDTVWLATTQFEPGNARRAFPCFDEPAFKATFEISILRKRNLQAISNMPRKNDGNQLYDNFETTRVMPTYLIAFIVSDFVALENDTENFKVWARKGAIEQAQYSFEIGPSLLHAIEEFLLDFKYPMPKMDEVAVPDFSAGAMENWGLTTYRERIILYDKDHATAGTKQQIATVVAHEFAHQWFGDLVSPEWWNYLWLNEGFATYFESFATDMVERDWRLREQFVVRDLQSALAADALSTSHPITQFVDSPNSIRSIFDTISYEKAGSVIRMMEHFLTTEVFKEGLKRYLQIRQYSNANEEHLYDAMNEKFLSTKPELYEDVAKIMHTWTRQPGYPVLTITSEEENQLTITQKRFLLTPTSTAEEDDSLWTIPLTYAVQDSNFDDTSTKQWMRGSSLKISRPTEENRWFIFNPQQTVTPSQQTCRVSLTVRHFVMEERRTGIFCGTSMLIPTMLLSSPSS